MPYGYNGKIARVNLTTKQVSVEEPGFVFYRTYMGGRGIIANYLLKEVPAGIDAFDEENKIVFATSVVTGVPLAGFSRHSVGALSPLTGFWGESQAGGYWGPELKNAGFDAVIVEGKADHPVYLWIKDGVVEIRDASKMWGKDTGDAQDLIAEDVSEPRLRALMIGKAGENKVRFAGIASDLSHFHGRTGLGAVMGSKNLKGVACRGTKRIEFADREKIKELARWFADHYRDNVDNSTHIRSGTNEYYWNANHAALPTHNFRDGHFEGIENVTIQDYQDRFKVDAEGCFACPVKCKQVLENKEDGYYNVQRRYGGPEFETLGAFGSVCDVADLMGPVKGHELCNRYGLDTITTGLTIAFAMECYENGLITKEDTDGIDLRFGNMDAMMQMIEKIADRDGFGNILAEGSKRAAAIIGKGSIQYSMQVKGQEFACAEPRAKFGMALQYAISPTGADHLQAEHDGAFDPKLTGYSHGADDPMGMLKTLFPMGILEPVKSLYIGPEKVRLVTYLQHFWSMFDTLELCIFPFEPVRTFPINKIVEAVQACTGWESSLFEILKVGERGTTMARCFNVVQGATPADDRLPDRLFEALQKGALEGSKLDRDDVDRAVKIYYEMMGWDGKTGIPTEGKLHELNIGWIDDLIRQKREEHEQR
jgi:aldehyde:ferredoxin oxidoreductase